MNDNKPLNAQQYAALQARFRADLNARISDIELRKLALDHACRLMACPHVLLTPADLHVMFREFHAFLSEPLRAGPPS